METINLKFYKIINVLGKGGMATVYLAKHRMLQNEVAIKVLSKEFLYNTNIKNRFISEARKLAELDHPNIVRVIDLIDNEDQVAFVMEYLEGESLKDTLKKKKLNDLEIERILKHMVSALAYVHEEGLIHRDIKPSNFIFDKRGILKLTDFGISKDISAENSEYTQTATHINMGTPMYMSPEQIRSLKDLTKLTDIYSLGVVLWEMVSGKKPYNTQTLSSFELQTIIVNENLPLTNTEWDGLIQKATRKEEEKRLNNLKNFLYPQQIEINEDDYDEKTIVYSKKRKEEEKSNNVIEGKRKKRWFIYLLLILAVTVISGFILHPYLDSKIKGIVSLNPPEENTEIVEEKPLDKSDIKYRSKIKNSNDYEYLANLSHNKKIIEFLKAEDEGNWEVLTYLFSDKIEKYGDIKKPTYAKLYNAYEYIWRRSSNRKNDVENIERLSSNEYKVKVSYNYTKVPGDVRKHRDKDLYFKFDKTGEILVVDEFGINSIRTLTEKEIKDYAMYIERNFDDTKYNAYHVLSRKKEEFSISHYSEWIKREDKSLILKLYNGSDFIVNDGQVLNSKEVGDYFHMFENYYKSINTYLIKSGLWESDWLWYDYVNMVSGDYMESSSAPIISPDNKKFITFYNGGAFDETSYFEVYSVTNNKYKKEKISEIIDYSFITDIKWVGNNKIVIENSELSYSGPLEFTYKNTIHIEYRDGSWTKV